MTFALLEHLAGVCGFYGLLLALAGIVYDRQSSRRIRVMFALLVIGLVSGLWAVTAYAAADLPCNCNACSGLTPSDTLYWLLGCWV